MNKSELVKALADKINQTQVEAKAFLDAFTDTVSETLKSGDKITLVGFGTFDVLNVAARTGRNPRTGEAIQIKEERTQFVKTSVAF